MPAQRGSGARVRPEAAFELAGAAAGELSGTLSARDAPHEMIHTTSQHETNRHALGRRDPMLGSVPQSSRTG
jgi:hypothetical protein